MSARLVVITPTLGRATTLETAIQSVRDFAPSARHVLSAPESQLPSLRERYPHCTVVADGGPAEGMWGALNSAMKACVEPPGWFTYLNDDDLLLPGFVTLCERHFAQSRPASIAYGDVELIDVDGRFVGRVTTTAHPRMFMPLLLEGIAPLTQQGMLVNAEVIRQIGYFEPSWTYASDLEYWVRAHARGISFQYYPLRVAQYRIRPGQFSSNVGSLRQEMAVFTRQNHPTFVDHLLRPFARIYYRLANLPRYLERFRQVGPRTSRDLFTKSDWR